MKKTTILLAMISLLCQGAGEASARGDANKSKSVRARIVAAKAAVVSTETSKPSPQPAHSGVIATCATAAATPAATVDAKPAAPPSPFANVILSGEYRARYNHTAIDRRPAAGPETAVNTFDHRLRLGAIFPVYDDVLLISRFTTQASRWGDFRVPSPGDPFSVPQFGERQFDFDKLSLYWTADKDTHVFLGRGDTRYFNADLALATGRFNDDDTFFEALLVERQLDDETMLVLSASPWTLNTPLLNGDPRQFQIGAYAVELKRKLEGGHHLQLFVAGLDPNRPVPTSPGLGQRAFLVANLRYDHKFNDELTAFASGSLNLTQVNGFTFLPLNAASEGDRAGFFGGFTVGNSQKKGGSQFEGYYVKTGPQATNIVSEFANGIEQVRGLFSHQLRENMWVRASAARQVADTLAPGVTRNDVDTAFLDVLKKF